MSVMYNVQNMYRYNQFKFGIDLKNIVLIIEYQILRYLEVILIIIFIHFIKQLF